MTDRRRLPGPWQHESGYRLNADGKAIKYRHPDTKAEIVVEAAVNEEDGFLEYITFAFDGGGDSMAHPKIHSSKSAAWDTAERWADEWA